MKILIQAPFNLDDKAKAEIESKIQKLDKYAFDVVEANVFFKLKDSNIENGVTTEIRLRIPGPDIFVSDVKQDYKQAFKAALEKARRQLIKAAETNRPY